MVEREVHQNGFYLFIDFCGSNHFMCNSSIVCCSLDPVLGIGYCIPCIQNQLHFFNSKKGNWVPLCWVKYTGVDSCC